VSKWQPIDSVPYNVEVEVKIDRRIFPAILRPDASMTSEEESCDQWQATTDRHPACWSEGACWESNADEVMSLQPEAWRALARKEPTP
jgi:hypothetical protein